MKAKSKKAVAEHFGVDVKTVFNWIQAGCPGKGPGGFDLVAMAAWRDRKQGKAPAQNSRQGLLSPQQGKDFEDARLKKAKADLAEMEVKARRQETAEWGQVEEAFRVRIQAVKQGLLALPRSLPPQLVHCSNEREMEVIIQQAVRALLEAFARPLVVGGKEVRGETAEEGGQIRAAEGGG